MFTLTIQSCWTTFRSAKNSLADVGLKNKNRFHFCSSWQGKIYYFEEGRPTNKLIDTWADQHYAADIDVIEKKKMLICPTLMSNKVIAYKIED